MNIYPLKLFMKIDDILFILCYYFQNRFGDGLLYRSMLSLMKLNRSLYIHGYLKMDGEVKLLDYDDESIDIYFLGSTYHVDNDITAARFSRYVKNSTINCKMRFVIEDESIKLVSIMDIR